MATSYSLGLQGLGFQKKGLHLKKIPCSTDLERNAALKLRKLAKEKAATIYTLYIAALKAT